jgi:hypothetical protein
MPVLLMFPRSVIDTTRALGDATTWSVIYDCHSDDSRGIIHDCNISMILFTGMAKCVHCDIQLSLLSRA